MADETDNDARQEDPADVLAGMAAEEAGESIVRDELEAMADPLSALTAMESDGGDAADGLDHLLADGQPPSAEAETAGDAQEDPSPVLAGAPTGQEAARVRRAHAAGFDAKQARAHAHAYKKMMMPFLLVVGGLLALVGLLSAGMVISAAASPDQRANPWLTLIALVSFPMAAVLFLGAWMFHRDVSRHS